MNGTFEIQGDVLLQYNRIEKNAVIPEGVKRIESRVFCDCSRLKSLRIPSTVTEIAEDAICFCYNLTKLSVAKDNPYYRVKKGKLIDIRTNKLLYLNPCEATEVYIDSSIKCLGEYALSDCRRIETLTIAGDVIGLTGKMFQRLESLKNIIVEGGTGRYIVKGNCLIDTREKVLVCGCNSSTIPDDGSVIGIGANAFESRRELEEIEIPKGVVAIGECAFLGCGKLKKIVIPEGITRIEDRTFANCFELKEIDLPNSVESIGNSAFALSGLKHIKLSDNVKEIGEWAFSHCTRLCVGVPVGCKYQPNSFKDCYYHYRKV